MRASPASHRASHAEPGLAKAAEGCQELDRWQEKHREALARERAMAQEMEAERRQAEAKWQAAEAEAELHKAEAGAQRRRRHAAERKSRASHKRLVRYLSKHSKAKRRHKEAMERLAKELAAKEGQLSAEANIRKELQTYAMVAMQSWQHAAAGLPNQEWERPDTDEDDAIDWTPPARTPPEPVAQLAQPEAHEEVKEEERPSRWTHVRGFVARTLRHVRTVLLTLAAVGVVVLAFFLGGYRQEVQALGSGVSAAMPETQSNAHREDQLGGASVAPTLRADADWSHALGVASASALAYVAFLMGV